MLAIDGCHAYSIEASPNWRGSHERDSISIEETTNGRAQWAPSDT